jgi:hypothetical protein
MKKKRFSFLPPILTEQRNGKREGEEKQTNQRPPIQSGCFFSDPTARQHPEARALLLLVVRPVSTGTDAILAVLPSLFPEVLPLHCFFGPSSSWRIGRPDRASSRSGCGRGRPRRCGVRSVAGFWCWLVCGLVSYNQSCPLAREMDEGGDDDRVVAYAVAVDPN